MNIITKLNHQCEQHFTKTYNQDDELFVVVCDCSRTLCSNCQINLKCKEICGVQLRELEFGKEARV